MHGHKPKQNRRYTPAAVISAPSRCPAAPHMSQLPFQSSQQCRIARFVAAASLTWQRMLVRGLRPGLRRCVPAGASSAVWLPLPAGPLSAACASRAACLPDVRRPSPAMLQAGRMPQLCSPSLGRPRQRRRRRPPLACAGRGGGAARKCDLTRLNPSSKRPWGRP